MIYRIIGDKHLWENSLQGGGASDEFRIIGASSLGLDALAQPSSFKVVDTETTGLKWMQCDRVFSIGMSNATGPVYYINFQDYSFLPEDLFGKFESDWVFSYKERLKPLFENDQVWVGQNIKFDYHMLMRDNFHLKGSLEDTMIRERILENDHMSYSLKNILIRKLPQYAKDDAVDNYITNNGLYHVEEVTGKTKTSTIKYFHMVPFTKIAPYGAMDVFITRELYLDQEKRRQYENEKKTSLDKVFELESKVLTICCEAEERGVLIDREYCVEALKEEQQKILNVEEWFFATYKKHLIDSSKELSPMFIAAGFNPPKTIKNNDSISGEFLTKTDGELAQNILKYRDASKRADTYFKSYLVLSDEHNFLHADMKQTGTRTGRFSYSDPNLQNIPSEEVGTFPVRKALIPRPGYFFLMIDYSQQEFRLMLEYAKEMALIEKIKKGYDPHQATADLTGLTRREAKSLNFGLIYGMGLQKLADQLGVTYDEAREFKQKYFKALPRVKRFIYGSSDVAKERGAVYTWLKRKLDFPQPDFAYKAVNAIIQGGCADITKLAMCGIDAFIKQNKCDARILLQVHDELLFEVPFEEVHIVPELQRLMEAAYPYRHIPLTTSMAYSLDSFHDAIEVGNVTEIQSAIGARFPKDSEEVLRGT